MNYMIGIIMLLLAHEEYMASPTPINQPGYRQRLTPYIKHWEAANFDRTQLKTAHQKHIEQTRHRKKRDLNAGEFGPAHTIKLKFYAHDREFRLLLRQNPLSVFTSDVNIENTQGPIHYDISRIYTGSLEDDENSHVHAILTSDNLLDGTIETSSEQYYIEPAHRYSNDLLKSGIHSIVYKVSDVNMKSNAAATSSAGSASSTAEHCASERLRRNMLLDELKRRKSTSEEKRNLWKITATPLKTNRTSARKRQKRWLPPDESTGPAEDQNPPLPLDLEVPYNDDFSIYSQHPTIRAKGKESTTRTHIIPPPLTSRNSTTEIKENPNVSVITTWRNAVGIREQREEVEGTREAGFTPSLSTSTAKTIRNRNIIVNSYNPSGGNSNSVRKTYTKHKNIIVSTYNNNNSDQSTSERNDDNLDHDIGDNFLNTNWTTMFVSNDRPSHKTHVEIITKNGATKKPQVIQNFNPDIVLAPNPHNPNYNSMLMTNLLSGRGGQDSLPDNTYDQKITCMLYLQADHTFFQKMGSDEASIEAITRHVQRANSIYRNTDFNHDGKPDNITFMIKRIKVHNTNAIKDPSYRFPGNYGVEKFLELFSEEDYDAFCLAYMFTYRDFEMGTLGLAWTGDLKNAGGVCEKNGHYRGSLKSLNTGIVTLLNYGKHVPPAVSHVTLAHEIGHNFGSPHDPEQCTPGGEDGNYIMFARATSGDKKNNNKFSPCSLKSIEPVLNAKARSAKGCFTEPQTSICGNGVVETGEECDCGWEEDCKDSCCFPMSRHARLDEKPCTLTPRAMCSPSQGPCCTTECKLKFGDKCRNDNGCRDPSFCDGRVPQCPPSVNKPNKTICNKEFVCYMGECTGSICLAYGLESCQCIPGPHDDKIKSCELCCKLPGEDNPCRSSFEWNESPFDVPDMYAKPGTPCNDYNGYCDVFQKCREVDPSGPLATLRKLLLSEESIASFKKWVQQNWYTVALAIVGVFVLLVLSTKLLAKRSNLKLKSVTIIHSATTETVRLPEDNNGVIVHTAVRTKVPFKKKVRGERSGNKGVITGSRMKSGGGIKMTKSGSKSAHIQTRGANAAAPVTIGAVELKKAVHNKKTKTGGGPLSGGAVGPTTSTSHAMNLQLNEKSNSSDQKIGPKSKKHQKETIDYSTKNASTAADPISGSHTNTFGKVQKWLLESPIIAQPLSHIEHSSKVRKVIGKSHSTPERLVQKSPQKTKSVGNLSNEKVKLQVVYKPPFKFSLRLSKNTKVKTHVVGGSGAISKQKRQPNGRNGGGARNDSRKYSNKPNDETSKSGERTKRALLLRANNDEDNQILTLNEPNYETLNSKMTPPATENLYENLQYTQLNEAGQAFAQDHNSSKATTSSNADRMSRSSSKTNLEIIRSAASAQSQHPQSYSRSNSLTSNNPFVVSSKTARKFNDGSTNFHRSFGSTQNLINSRQSQKKRRSLNLNLSVAKTAKDVASKTRCGSNTNSHHDNSTVNTKPDENHSTDFVIEPTSSPSLKHRSSNISQHRSQPKAIAHIAASGGAVLPRARTTADNENSTTGDFIQTTTPASSFNIARKSIGVSMLPSSAGNNNAAIDNRRNRSQFHLKTPNTANATINNSIMPSCSNSVQPQRQINRPQLQKTATAILNDQKLPSNMEVSDINSSIS